MPEHHGDTGGGEHGADPYDRARARGRDHAVRVAGRTWLFLIWHCWQNSTAYNPE